MRTRYGLDGTNVVADTTEDRDLIAMINEARDPAEVDRIVAMARHRQRNRRDASHAKSRRRRPAFRLGRVLSFRH
ncbi:MAG: hypothetical protein ACXVR1_00640 [Solirubrobacteraceae bacterium]